MHSALRRNAAVMHDWLNDYLSQYCRITGRIAILLDTRRILASHVAITSLNPTNAEHFRQRPNEHPPNEQDGAGMAYVAGAKQ